MKELRSIDAAFVIDLRINFDDDNMDDVPELLKILSDSFRGDERFQVLIRPVGRWGGSQDDLIPVCEWTAADM